MEARTVFTGIVLLMTLLSFQALTPITSIFDYMCIASIIMFTTFTLIAYFRSVYFSYRDYQIDKLLKKYEDD